jgi:hypothetical protein
MRAQEGLAPFNNAAASTQTFNLEGGQYAIITKSTGSGTIDVSILGPDGSTYIPCGYTQVTATSSYTLISLPPGSYKMVIATFTANYVVIARVPGE